MERLCDSRPIEPSSGRGLQGHAGHDAARRLCQILHAAADRADLTEDVSLYDNTSNAAAVPENSPVLPERSHYFDAGVIQKINSNLTVGIDGSTRLPRT